MGVRKATVCRMPSCNLECDPRMSACLRLKSPQAWFYHMDSMKRCLANEDNAVSPRLGRDIYARNCVFRSQTSCCRYCGTRMIQPIAAVPRQHPPDAASLLSHSASPRSCRSTRRLFLAVRNSISHPAEPRMLHRGLHGMGWSINAHRKASVRHKSHHSSSRSRSQCQHTFG